MIRNPDGSYMKDRHIIVVSGFILMASLLVVLTTYAVSMLTATGDLNQLMVDWSDDNLQSIDEIVRYFETGNNEYYEAYQRAKSDRIESRKVIDELLSDDPNPDLIIREFNPSNIHPNEITGLIRIFTLFLWGGVGPEWATRVEGLLFTLVMIGAIAMVHAQHGWNSLNMGNSNGLGMEFQVLIISVSLLYAFRGNALAEKVPVTG